MSQTTCGGDGGRFNRRAALATWVRVWVSVWRGAGQAHATRAPVRPEDEGFMRMAIAEAAKGDFPFGRRHRARRHGRLDGTQSRRDEQ